MRESETYLGDGLYASYDGYQIRLRAPRLTGDHEVFLDEFIYRQFIKYVETLKPGRRWFYEKENE